MNPTTITTAYEVLEMSVSEIAEDQGLEEAVVKTVLLQNSSKYGLDVKNGKTPDISDSEYAQILATYKSLALYSENDFVRERALRKLIDERKGRFDKKDIVSLRVNILVVNQMLAKTRALREKEAINV